ncbi:hypothetical protein DSL92_06545 [Billgrantia gudaonensis]|uniref:Uncharacterized protein n=1 Tax=Billgrantia gudaonensis TaxID=376427 RepID=A0A3S0NWU4_9GAMM|nr:hypothetical protein DSL92_06545 [Halomonas gudaonensis]
MYGGTRPMDRPGNASYPGIVGPARRHHHSMPGNLYSHTANPVIKEVLFNVSEHAGRERAIISGYRPRSTAQRCRPNIAGALPRHRRRLLERRPPSTITGLPRLTTARNALEAGFLGRLPGAAPGRPCSQPSAGPYGQRRRMVPARHARHQL